MRFISLAQAFDAVLDLTNIHDFAGAAYVVAIELASHLTDEIIAVSTAPTSAACLLEHVDHGPNFELG
jgi:hypothetical protein